MDNYRAGLDPSQPSTGIHIHPKRSRNRNKAVAHQVNGEHKTPNVCESHDQALDGGEIESVLYNDVDQAKEAGAEHEKLIAAVRPDRVHHAIFGRSVTGVKVLAEKWEDDPTATKVSKRGTTQQF